MATLIYLYNKKYNEIEKQLEKLPSNFFVMKEQATSQKASSLRISSVPAIVILDNSGNVRVKREGSALVLDYVKSFTED